MRILLLGATGNIGNSFLKIKSNHTLVGISYFNNKELAYEIINKYNLEYFYSKNDSNSSCQTLDELIIKTKPDLIINAVVGIAGLEYTICAIKHKIKLALANKESLVVAGHFIKQLLFENNVELIPIDSEHTSLKELILSHPNNIKKLYITCSGGRYYELNKKEWNKITYDEAIKHPNWIMGKKISIDSATLMNKCFEIVEAYYLFNTKNIEALYHKQSIIHSLIEFDDNTIFCNMSNPDMISSIELAINNFQKTNLNPIKPLSFDDLNLTLKKINKNEWKPIQWAYDIINDQNHSLGLIINFANEKAIELFSKKIINFNQIYDVIEWYINNFKNKSISNLDELFNFLNILKEAKFNLESET